jgi:hypothetical protein
MADCRVCNAPITWAVTTGAGDLVPLDDHEQRDYGSGRYRVITDGTRPVVAAVPEQSPVRTWVDHRMICQQPRAI